MGEFIFVRRVYYDVDYRRLGPLEGLGVEEAGLVLRRVFGGDRRLRQLGGRGFVILKGIKKSYKYGSLSLCIVL